MFWGTGSALGFLDSWLSAFAAGSILSGINRLEVPIWMNDEVGAYAQFDFVMRSSAARRPSRRNALNLLLSGFLRRLGVSRAAASIAGPSFFAAGLFLFFLDFLVYNRILFSSAR